MYLFEWKIMLKSWANFVTDPKTRSDTLAWIMTQGLTGERGGIHLGLKHAAISVVLPVTIS